jgi:hypothetical protein
MNNLHKKERWELLNDQNCKKPNELLLVYYDFRLKISHEYKFFPWNIKKTIIFYLFLKLKGFLVLFLRFYVKVHHL